MRSIRRIPPHVLAISLVSCLLLLVSAVRRSSIPENNLEVVSELDFLPPNVDLIASEDVAEKTEADAYFAGQMMGSDSSNTSILTWPDKNGDFNPLDKGSVARAIFNAVRIPIPPPGNLTHIFTYIQIFGGQKHN